MKTLFKSLIPLMTLLCFAYSNIHAQSSQVYLDGYELVNGPIKITDLNNDTITDLSGVTYNPLTNTLFMITNNNSKIYETNLVGETINSINLNNANDTEDIVHIGGTAFAIAEERLGEILYVDIAGNPSAINLAAISNRSTLLPDIWGANNGLEGVSYDPATNRIFTLKERSNINLYNFTKTDGNVTPPSCNLGTSISPAITDVAAVHHLGLTEGINAPAGISDRILVLSEESNVLIEVDESCGEYSRINLPAGTTDNQGNSADTQLEGVTMDGDGNIYVVGEPNELYIYSVNCRNRDSLILVELYQNNGGSNWEDFPWNLSQPMDTWYGVATNADGCVTQVVLDEQGLTGTIPTSLGGLTELTHLDLFRNDLTGPIPPELGNLSNLLYMDLNLNGLIGTIPAELSNLSKLRRLNLSSNDLTGTIPPELGNLSSLTDLTLSSNQLGGAIPPELGNLSQLTRLFLNHNELTNAIPSQIGDLSKLITLRLDNNQLNGEIPAQLGGLDKLTLLYLHRNQLQGEIPFQSGDLPKIVRLYFYVNNLSGAIPPALGSMSNLKYLHLGNNGFTGELPGELANLTKLIYLVVSSNDLSGCYDNNLSNLCNQLNNTTNTNSAISNGNNFDVSWETFCGTGAGACTPIITCRQTDSLALVALHDATDGANWNTKWDLNQPIDTWHGIVLNADGCVRNIFLQNNGLAGTIPREIGSIEGVDYLALSNNSITGTIPPELGDLSNMRYLYISHNQLEGTIPTTLGNLPNIRYIYLNGNQLEGEIPASFGNLATIQRILIHVNQLTGEIPPSFGSLPNLTVLGVSHNQLSGCYDDNLLNLCSQLDVNTSINQYISNGNNFDTTWQTFCSAGYCVQTKVEDEDNNYVLQNYPNPFSTSTTIEYNIPESATNPTLDIFDLSGKLMYSQSINQTGTGTIEIQVGTLAPGVYHYRLSMGDAISATKRMVIMK